MKKTAYIHIGLQKTGTTAIQSTLQEFLVNGKLNRFDMQFHHSDTLEPIQYFKITGDKEYFIEQTHKNIQKHSRIGEKNVIYSNERITDASYYDGLRFDYNLLPLLATAFKDYDTKIIVYLRRQDLFIESRINQKVKGFRYSLYSNNNAHINYKELLDKCQEYFGEVIVRKYERESLYKSDAVTDFLHVVGLDELIDDYIEHKGKTANSSLSPRAFRIAIADNKQYLLSDAEIKSKIEELDSKYKSGIITRREYVSLKEPYLYGHDASHRYKSGSNSMRTKLLKGNSNFSLGSSSFGLFSAEERAEILAKYAESNAAVAREYFGSEDGVLFNDKVPKNIVDINSGPTAEDIVQTFMPIITNLAERCERLEKSPLRRLIDDTWKRSDRIRKIVNNSPRVYAFLYKIFRARK